MRSTYFELNVSLGTTFIHIIIAILTLGKQKMNEVEVVVIFKPAADLQIDSKR